MASLGDSNIAVTNMIVGSATTAEVDVTIGAQANVGLHQVNMTTGGEQASISPQGPTPGSWTYTDNAKGEHGSILGGLLYAPLENDANNSASGFGVFDPVTGSAQTIHQRSERLSGSGSGDGHPGISPRLLVFVSDGRLRRLLG